MDRYRDPLPPPPAHQQHQSPGQVQSPQYQQRRPSQQPYYDQPSLSQNYQPPSPHDDQPSSPEYFPASSSQPHRQPQPQPQPQPQQQRPPPSQHSHSQSKKSRSFSLQSDKNHKRSASNPEGEAESAADKESRRLHSKADPTLAISEAEPAVIAAMTQSSLASLRTMRHRDSYGNPISDPDKSNPTRNRWERPLDTVRSFEAAIDGAYNRKSMMQMDPVASSSRRSSYHPGAQPRFRPDSYYSSRPVSFRPEHTQFDLGGMSTRSSMYGFDNRGHNDVYGASYGPGPSRQRVPRTYTEPYYRGRDQNVYHLPHKDRSYETVTSAEGSGSSDPVGYQTDPTSSDNSSIERHSPAKRSEPVNDYGIGFTQPQTYQSLSLGSGANQAPPPPAHGPIQQNRPAVPRKEVPTVLKRQSTQQPQQQRAAAPEKRKSWLSRRFSKKN